MMVYHHSHTPGDGAGATRRQKMTIRLDHIRTALAAADWSDERIDAARK